MMPDAVCNLHTGLQGHGKTLLTLAHVEALRLGTNRPVFYSGIRELTLDWTEFGAPGPNPDKPWFTDPSKWYELPTGCIIVIDEAQRLFRPRGNGSPVPQFEQALETLRHNGQTLFLITQQPRLVSTHVRALCGVHRHYMRKFGFYWATCHEWAGVRDNCDKTRKDSIATQVRYPTEYFAKYKSSEVHTVKAGLPLKVKLALLVPLAMLVLAWYVFWGREWLRKPSAAPGTAAAAPAPGSARAGPGSSPGGGDRGKSWRAPQTVEALHASFKPRIPGLPFTAPRYDELTQPVRVPLVVGCVLQGTDQATQTGWCFTQQGNRLQLPLQVMRAFIESGQFVDFDAGPGLDQARERQAGTSSSSSPSGAQNTR
jgi:zona occludens toxin